MKNHIGILTHKDSTESVVALGYMVILTILILPLQEQGMYFHLFVSAFIFFIKDLYFSLYRSPPYVSFSSVQRLSRVWLFATPWIAAHQASLSINNSQSSLKLMSIESVMPSSRLILCRPLLLLPPIPPSIRVSSNESTLHMSWPKCWSFSFSTIPFKEHPGLISFRMD